jgi:hypothetical protein
METIEEMIIVQWRIFEQIGKEGYKVPGWIYYEACWRNN